MNFKKENTHTYNFHARLGFENFFFYFQQQQKKERENTKYMYYVINKFCIENFFLSNFNN